jgi:CheY-like chemotaxis protein
VKGALSGIRCLVVEDDVDTREVLEELLTDVGARVTSVSDIDTALALIQPGAFDLLLSDVGLPGTGGLELVRRLRARADETARLPAIAFSGHALPPDRARALAAGFDQHLGKPIGLKELVTTIGAVVRRET